MARMTRGERLIAQLRAQGHKASRPSFPDLSTAKPGLAPLSNTIAVRGVVCAPPSGLAAGSKHFSVGHLHKQGPCLITPGDIASGQLKYFGGKKPNGD